MFITAACFLFSVKLRWPKHKSIYENGTSFSLSPLEILFGLEQKNYPQVANMSIIKFNYALLFAQYYLYTQKLLKTIH